MGFKRVGCMPCINSNKEDIYNIYKRFPEVIKKLKLWEDIAGKTSKREMATFFPPKIKKGIPNNIEKTVSWAKTKHGGVKEREDVEKELPVCSSHYGLCE